MCPKSGEVDNNRREKRKQKITNEAASLLSALTSSLERMRFFFVFFSEPFSDVLNCCSKKEGKKITLLIRSGFETLLL